LRRVAAVSAVLLLAIVMLGTWPIWVVGTVVFDLIRRKWKLPTLRLVAFGLCWAWIEVAGLTVAALFWLSGQGRNLNVHFALQRWWAGALMAALRLTVGIRVIVENPEVLVPGPVLVLSRHASLADSLVSAYSMGNAAGLRPRYVLKRELQADPCLDIVGHRLPNYFLNRSSDNQEEELRGLARLGHDLGVNDVAVIFVEGTRANPHKREKILAAMAERSPERAARLRGLQHLLPPKPAGALALLEAAPDVDVVIAGHTGFDGLDTFGGMLKQLEAGAGVTRMWFVRIARCEVPAEGLIEWLDERWLELDRAVAERLGQAGKDERKVNP
jgi:1-acyl-sn-glycerol-3-phosphate acyltransferase